MGYPPAVSALIVGSCTDHQDEVASCAATHEAVKPRNKGAFWREKPGSNKCKKSCQPSHGKNAKPAGACPMRVSPCGRAGAKSRGLERRNLTAWKQVGRLLPGSWRLGRFGCKSRDVSDRGLLEARGLNGS